MPKKSTGSAKNGKTRKRIKKKKRDRFVTNALIISGVAILVVAAINYIGSNENLLPDVNRKEVISPENYSEVYDETDALCRFDFIDVGQGDSALITTPNKQYILIDTGTATSKSDLLIHLEESNVDEIDYLVISHPHSDHIGGAKAVLDEYKVNCIIMPNVVSNTSQFEKMYDAIVTEKEEGCKIFTPTPGDKYEIDGCIMNIIGPVEIDEEEFNNCSVALTFTYGEFDALFTGDTEKESEKMILSSGAYLDCELYKAAHHGSDTSSCEEFIAAVTPEVTVISCGKDNSYGHPSTKIKQRLYQFGSQVYITSEIGTVTVLTDGDGCCVLAET